ncbi:MAG: hypothetical protein EP335_13620 [Alphaproteobacteria bacterium]|nr:MAG: hypothetical protein EP335_13620 [Alphaproteobacteria bacterium]
MTATVLLLCLVIARLFLAPVDVSFARESIQERAAAVLPGWDIRFKDAVIGWDWRSVRPWVAITDLTLIDRRDRMRASVPEARLGVAFTSVLTSVSFSTIDINNPNVVITDIGAFSDANSDSDLMGDLFGENGLPKPEILRPVTEGFSRFGARLLTRAPGLDRIVVRNASVDIARGQDMPNAHISLPQFRLSNEDNAIAMRAIIDASLADAPTQITLSGKAEPLIGEVNVSLAFSGFTPASLAAHAKLPDFVSLLQFPVGLNLELDLASNIGLRAARFAVDIDDGVLSDPVHYPNPAQIRYGTVRGDYDVAEQILAIRQVELAAGDKVIRGDGVIYWEEGGEQPGVRMFGTVNDISIAELLRYWPIMVHPDGTPRGARAWIDDHMLGGKTDEARFQLDIAPDGTGPFEDGSVFKLDFAFEDVDTKFLLSMPPIKGAAGRATLTESSFRLGLSKGAVLGMPIAGTVAELTDINIQGGATGTFSVRAAGPVPTVMELISYPPLEVPQKMGFDASRLDGQAVIRAVISTPLVKDLPKEAVHYDVQATLTDTRVADLLGGEGLTGATLALALTPDELDANGHGKLNGVPLDLHWHEDMAAGRTDPDADTSRITLSGRMDQNDLKAFGVDISDYLQGPVLGDATFVGRSLKFRAGSFSADTTGAVVRVPQLVWQKPANAPASATGTVVFDDAGTHLLPLVLAGEGVDLSADFHWGPKDSGLFSGQFDIKQLGRNEGLAGTIDQRPDRPLVVDMWARQFDLAPLMDSKPGQAAKDSDGDGPLQLSLKADRILLENAVVLEHASARTSFVDGAPTMMDISGQFPNAKTEARTVITVLDDGKTLRPIHIESPDAGRLLRGLGLFAHLSGGNMVLDGVTGGWGKHLVLNGKGTISGALLVPKSALGDGITEGVISGLDNYLASGPLDLSSIEIPFEYKEQLLDLNGLKANGPSMGMTMEGQIEADDGRINVNGVIVPAYGINSLLGKIPLVGGLFSGGDGKGLFGVAYRVKGMTEGPEVTVNALSGLAPGFLRLLFEGKKGRVSDVEAPKQVPAPEPVPEEKPADLQEPQPEPAEQQDADTEPTTGPVPQ